MNDRNLDDEDIIVSDTDEESTVEIGGIDEARKVFEGVREEVKKMTKDQRHSQIPELMDRHLETLRLRRTNDGKTFLHVLAYDSSPKLPVKWLVASFVSKGTCHSQMAALDNHNRSPTHAALAEGNTVFLDGIFKSVGPVTTDRVRAALKYELEVLLNVDTRVTTVLHTAMRNQHNFSPNLLKKIIEMVPEDMFCVQDSNGRTPLHLAVDYRRCTEGQLEVVQHLLARGPSALEIKTTYPPDRADSVYQYHEYTRKIAAFDQSRAKARLPAPSKPDLTILTVPRSPMKPPSVAERLDAQKPAVPMPDANKARDRHNPKAGGIGPIPPGSAKPTMTPVMRPRLHPDTDILPANSFLQAMARIPDFPNEDMAGSNNDKPQKGQISADVADKIREELKLLCLRMMSPDHAVRCLSVNDDSGTASTKVLWFDFVPKPTTKMTIEEFQQHWATLEFDSTLQYVALPQMEFSLGKDGAPRPGRGRNDVRRIFDWLRSMGVQRVIRVIVDDMGPACHSDEEIEAALHDMKVEILDWRRPDLCPSSICRIGGHVRELYLQWSGNNATLRAWSEKEGLPQLPKLETLFVVVLEDGLESHSRTNTNLELFRRRLLHFWPTDDGQQKPRVDFLRPSGGPRETPSQHAEASAGASRQESQVDQHRWIQCMAEFFNLFLQVPRPGDELTRQRPALKPTKIALIDDGVTTTSASFGGKLFRGKSFDFYENGQRNSPYWISTSGHGTSMAQFIRKICRTAEIYVIKLRTLMPQNGSSSLPIDTRSAIEAIEHAIDQRVKIICMAWTLKVPEGTEKVDFDNAIRKATNAGIIMFCAASDQGDIGDITYPYASNMADIFRIGAAKATGTTLDMVGDPHRVNFSFPGHQMFPNDQAPNKQLGDAQTGSSVATALATGLATLVLECIRLGHYWTIENQRALASMAEHLSITSNDLNVSPAGMRSAFLNMGQSKSTYIWVWNTFEDSVNEEIKYGDKMGKLAAIARLARKFLGK